MPDARPAARPPWESSRRPASGDVEAVYRSCRAIYRQPDRYLGCLIGARSCNPNATTPVAPTATLKHRLLPLLLQRATWCLCLPARQRRIQPPLVPHSWGKIKKRRGASPLCTPHHHAGGFHLSFLRKQESIGSLPSTSSPTLLSPIRTSPTIGTKVSRQLGGSRGILNA